MTIPPPSDADRARSVAADYAVCEAATSPPWIVEKPDHDIDNDNEWFVGFGEKTVKPGCAWYEADSTLLNEANAVFIAAARMGWPATIRLLAEARTLLAKCHKCIDEAMYLVPFGIEEREALTQLRREIAALLEGNPQ